MAEPVNGPRPGTGAPGHLEPGEPAAPQPGSRFWTAYGWMVAPFAWMVTANLYAVATHHARTSLGRAGFAIAGAVAAGALVAWRTRRSPKWRRRQIRLGALAAAVWVAVAATA